MANARDYELEMLRADYAKLLLAVKRRNDMLEALVEDWRRSAETRRGLDHMELVNRHVAKSLDGNADALERVLALQKAP